MLQYQKLNAWHSQNKCIKRMYALPFWSFKFEPHVCNKCHDVLVTAYELKNIAILTVKRVYYRCILWTISKN